MKTKASNKSNELVDIFQHRLGWNKARIKLFVSFIIVHATIFYPREFKPIHCR